MRKSKFSEEQIIWVLREAEGDMPAKAVCIFSNGGFGGIHGKLLERLKSRR